MYDMKSHSEMLRVAKIQTCNMHLITLNSTLQFNMKMPKNCLNTIKTDYSERLLDVHVLVKSLY